MTKAQTAQYEGYKKANKVRKAALLVKWGYTSQDEYFAELKLTSKKSAPAKVKVTKSSKKHKIHNVFIMDDSGSMSGGKYNNGVAGIQLLVEGIKADNLTDNTVSIVDLNRGVVHWMKHSKDVTYEGHRNLGGTPLYKTIGKTIDNLLAVVAKEDKVLLNITTDGRDTDGFGDYPTLAQTIKKVQEKNNFTVTFVGTQGDVDFVQRNLNVDASNTLVHDNTADGMKMSFHVSNLARTAYSSAVSEGLEVSKGFYKKTGTL